MSKQIIRQPDGRYLIFGSIVDNVIYYNLDKKQLLNLAGKEEELGSKEAIQEIIDELERGEKPYQCFTMPYEEALEEIEHQHGREEARNVRKLIEG